MKAWFRGFRFKMLMLVSISSVLLAGVSFYSINLLNDFDAKLHTANAVRIPLAQGTNEMATSVQTVARFLWLASITESPEEFKLAQSKIKSEIDQYEKSQSDVEQLPKNDFVQEKFKEINESWPALKSMIGRVLDEAAKGNEEGRRSAQRLIVNEMRPVIAKTTGLIDELNEYRIKLVKDLSDKDEQDAKLAKSILLMVSLISLLLVGTFGLWIASSVAAVLSQVIQNLSHHGREVSSASEGLSSSASALSSGATQTAGSLEETVASTEELNSMVQTNSANATQAADLANNGRQIAETGSKQISELYMAVGDVSVASKKIEEIINVIDDIAFQTNLLALNAAVEAARAGEQGKGFAVVADAVRSLAQRSSVAAKDIGQLIRDSVEKIENSRQLAESGKNSLGLIVQSICKISDINAEIAKASQEQAAGLGSISKAMNEIDQAAQQNAAASEEISATSEEMTAQSISLREMIDELTKFVEGGEHGKDVLVVKHASAKASTTKIDSKTETKGKVLEFKHPASLPKKQLDLEAALPLANSNAERTIGKVEGF